ncbi:3-deoxy-D-arabino-heptulosonate-7-phosphate synthase, phenylalanine repressible [Paraburkholderia ribeironis]|uniref:Phospho-2-dehydro-3-deoxyheptonate aldolase n=1 Tax=Paraburkholderia ribeironis TaxID=1247936 RepID=A0A1N7RY87_9BURK|nr:3-deoxy-7-phosphoheptulonate synthase [Paraburkholderia ribeironis]SIT40097.1 3-deoxy-D-arabino-heptulosonate-7-phosphate synthase, phenylalanine repressible [Paraburkholderia ribeironis]
MPSTSVAALPSRLTLVEELATPSELRAIMPLCQQGAALIANTRNALAQIFAGNCDRLALIVGPCSIHDRAAALEFARRLNVLRVRHADVLEVVMRAYFEKPRTTIGWKGWINDPDLDGSCRVACGLRQARELLVDINAIAMPVATEFLDVINAQYLDDLVSWGAIGARTTESQVHRQLASGLAAPIGFKNGTDGNVRIAIDAVKVAQQPHRFIALGDSGRPASVETSGNPACHIVLRGGKTPNYDAQSVDEACAQLLETGLAPYVAIDASHGNSGKDPFAQVNVCSDIAARIASGDCRIAGVMIESHLFAGRQDVMPGAPLAYGKSITDACLGWDDTAHLIDTLANAARARRCIRRPHGTRERRRQFAGPIDPFHLTGENLERTS